MKQWIFDGQYVDERSANQLVAQIVQDGPIGLNC